MAGDILYFLHRHFRAVFALSLTLGAATAYGLALTMARLVFGA